MKIRMFHGTTEISLKRRMSQIPRIGEKLYAHEKLWEIKDVRYDITRNVKSVHLRLKPIIEGVAEFNDSLDLLLEHFSDRVFDRSKKVSYKEVTSEPIWFRSPRKGPNDQKSKTDGVNIAYYPPTPKCKPMLHVRVYNPDEAKGVAELLKSLGLKPSIHDNDPYSKTDIEACLSSV